MPRPTTERFPGEHALVRPGDRGSPRADIASKSALQGRGGRRPEAVPADTGVSKPAPSRLDGRGEGHGVSKHKNRGPGGATALRRRGVAASAALEARAAALAAASARFPAPAAAAAAPAVTPAAELPAPSEARKRPTRRSRRARRPADAIAADELRERRIVRFQTFDNEEQSEAVGCAARPALAARSAVVDRGGRLTSV